MSGTASPRTGDEARDYGYDLAHEEMPSSRRREGGSGYEPGRQRPAAGKVDRGDDLGYDEAHDF